jgi:hypothetical protein
MNTSQITNERLERWKKKLAMNNATPIALIGVGQGPHLGEIVLCIPEDGISDADTATLLRGVADKLCP